MASASGSVNFPPTAEVKYCGPAGQEFASLHELGIYSLDNYFPNWRNYDHPKSYMIPSVLNRSDVNDVKQMTFRAIQQLVKEEFQAPVISLCKLNICKHADHFLHYFPTVPAKELGEMLQAFIHESDFVLIGPWIGIILIEVVSSFDKLSYKIALENISVRSETLVAFLEKCTKIKLSEGTKPRKILIAPNVEKSNVWGGTRNINHVLTLFKENLCYSSEKHNQIYYTLRKALEKAVLVPKELFETYGAIISAFASITASMSRKYLSVEDLEKTRLSNGLTVNISNILFLTPDQQKALDGPCRQLIIGAAGTGKTIVLQAKALQLLSWGQSVLVIAPENLLSTYKTIFDTYGFKNYNLADWDKGGLLNIDLEIWGWCSAHKTDGWNIVASIYESLKTKYEFAELKNWLFTYENILIDNMTTIFSLEMIIVIFAVASHFRENKTVWFAMDLNMLNFVEGNEYDGRVKAEIDSILRRPNDDFCYSIALFKQVLRCSENIFRDAYLRQMWHPLLTPTLGHRTWIEGPEVIKIDEECSSIDEARKLLAKKISEQLKNEYLTGKRFRLCHIGIITHGGNDIGALIDYLLNNVATEDGVKLLSQDSQNYNKCMVLDWRHAFSLEWPVVFFASCRPLDFRKTSGISREYIEYLSKSRAINKLIMINATYTESMTISVDVPPDSDATAVGQTLTYGTEVTATDLEERPEKRSVIMETMPNMATAKSIQAMVGEISAIELETQSPANFQVSDSVVPKQPNMSSNEWNKFSVMKPEDLVFGRENWIDRGAFGDVFKAVLANTNLCVAVKIVRTSNTDVNIKSEVELLKHVSHPHILSIMGVVEIQAYSETWIVTELLNAGSLRFYATGKDRDRLNAFERSKIGVHCWSGLAYLHENKITHKDIAPQNIVLHKMPDGSLIAKVCDFGLAKIKESLAGTQSTEVQGTPMYYPPEFTELKRNAWKADVYSMGATLCEVFTNFPFWYYKSNGEALDSHQVIFHLKKIYDQMAARNPRIEDAVVCNAADILDHRPDYRLSIKNILKKTVSFDRNQRPSASEALKIFQDALSVKN